MIATWLAVWFLFFLWMRHHHVREPMYKAQAQWTIGSVFLGWTWPVALPLFLLVAAGAWILDVVHVAKAPPPPTDGHLSLYD